MSTPSQAEIMQEPTDLTNCDREPIRIPGSIQPHGLLLVLTEPDLVIQQASENVEMLLGMAADAAVGQTLGEVLGEEFAANLQREVTSATIGSRPLFHRNMQVSANGVERVFLAIVHRTEDGIFLELEIAESASDQPLDEISGYYARLDAFTLQAEETNSVEELSNATAAAIRQLTGFDRVLVYRFDPEWNGTVVGEDGNGNLPRLMHHRFPASDIPAQARELYRLNRIRIIPDAGYRPVPLVPPFNPVTNQPLDMTFSVLRSVSPIHVEYMRNMETMSSMSVSILREGRLWGLISCHHREPRRVSFPIRQACDLFARSYSLRLSALEHAQDYERRIQVRSVFSKLLAVMADRGDFALTLSENPRDLLTFVEAQGAAIVTEEQCYLLGETPPEADVRQIAAWLYHTTDEEVYFTDSLTAEYPPARMFHEQVSGVLAIAVSKLHPSYIIWMRPEVERTILWGGDPTKPVQTSGDAVRLHPRRSFETWKQTVREKSLPWNASEVEGAGELRNAIVGIVLRKAEELADLNFELTRSNKELEAFSYSVSHDLRAPLRHIVGYAEVLKESGAGKFSANDERCLATIIESSEYAGKLVDKLLSYSRLGRAELQISSVDMNLLVSETQHDVMRDAAGRNVIWHVEKLPVVEADLMMLRMAVRDLLSNALKYSRSREEAVIEVGSRDKETETVFFVKDNGVGFDMDYADKLFGVFQRLHRWEDYEGTGIGLANVRRVMERHGGRAWAEGAEGQGATFYFSLPKTATE